MSDRMKPGAMRERITLERRVETVTPSGAVSVEWIAEATLRAELVQEDAQAFLSSVDSTVSKAVFRIWAIGSISTDFRLIHDGRTYRIAKTVPLQPLGMELHCIDGDGQ